MAKPPADQLVSVPPIRTMAERESLEFKTHDEQLPKLLSKQIWLIAWDGGEDDRGVVPSYDRDTKAFCLAAFVNKKEADDYIEKLLAVSLAMGRKFTPIRVK